jgi:outer membrane protein OmpA-like peptidoglycan-associated protein
MECNITARQRRTHERLWAVVAALFTAACGSKSSDHPPVSADTLLQRSQRLQNLQRAPLDPTCCAEVPLVEERPVQAVLTSHESMPDSLEILFDTGSSHLGPKAERALHAIADYLILHPEISRVEIGGYADIHGTVEGNARLAARRAEAVKWALVRHSVAPERLVTRSYGATSPAASSTTTSGMRRNRRVLIRMLGDATEGEAKVAP